MTAVGALLLKQAPSRKRAVVGQPELELGVGAGRQALPIDTTALIVSSVVLRRSDMRVQRGLAESVGIECERDPDVLVQDL